MEHITFKPKTKMHSFAREVLQLKEYNKRLNIIASALDFTIRALAIVSCISLVYYISNR